MEVLSPPLLGSGMLSWIWEPLPGLSGLPSDSGMVQVEKSLPAKQEIQVQSLSQEDPLEKEIAAHSSVLAWEILWTGEPGGLQSMRLQKSLAWLSD